MSAYVDVRCPCTSSKALASDAKSCPKCGSTKLTKQWRYHKRIELPNGKRDRVKGTPAINTQKAALEAERADIERKIHEAVIEQHAPGALTKEPAPTLTEWFRGDATGDAEFTGRYWRGHAIGVKENRGGTLAEKRRIFEQHIEPTLGAKRLDEIDEAVIDMFRADLMEREGRTGLLGEKSRGNIIGVLSTALRYAFRLHVIERMPYIEFKKPKKKAVEVLDFAEYGRTLGAAIAEGEPWATGVMLAGEAGLRVGEVLALEWRDLDLVAGTITIARQIRRGAEGPTKGGDHRTVPMTPRLVEHLRSLPRIRAGRVVADDAGVPMSEGDAKHRIYRVCRLAGLPERSWHTLRHTWATHLALLGLGPLRLQAWLGHSDTTMMLRYVHLAESHAWPIPDGVLTAGHELLDPTKRIVVQLGAREAIKPTITLPAHRRRGPRLAHNGSESGNSLHSFNKFVAGAGFEPATFGL